MSKSMCVLLFAALFAPLGLAQDAGLGGPAPARASGKVDLAQKVRDYTAFVRDPARFTAENAVERLHAGYDEVLTLNMEVLDLAKVDADPHGLLRGLFGLMLALDDRCAEFHQAGQYSDAIANAKRRALRAIRYLREAIMLRTAERAPEQLYAHGKPAFAESFPEHHWTAQEAFRAGGLAALPRTVILLCMGGSNVSATIARSADEDNTFSHLAVGYRSNAPQNVAGVDYPAGTLFLVESLIETGVIIKPFAEHYKGVDRDVIFMARDASKQPAIDAAMDAFFARANAAIHAGKPLKYDFSMGANNGVKQELEGGEAGEGGDGVLSDPTAYFCAAVGEEVFAKAGVELLPIRTQLNPGPNSRKLFESWGMDPDAPVMAPGDADVSPALIRVAEAGRLQDLLDNHLRQATLRQMFRWMDEDGYTLRVPWYIKVVTWAAGGLNDTFLDLGKVPSGMDKNILRSFMALDKAANLYYKALKQANDAFREEHGRSMLPLEMVAHLETIRDDVKGTRKWFRAPKTKK
ncbi:MAG: hypothetical protein KDD82_20460 [Planctomycetes bacterium]|nr:hypothetical protein [Planctomycetota bacterium]